MLSFFKNWNCFLSYGCIKMLILIVENKSYKNTSQSFMAGQLYKWVGPGPIGPPWMPCLCSRQDCEAKTTYLQPLSKETENLIITAAGRFVFLFPSETFLCFDLAASLGRLKSSHNIEEKTWRRTLWFTF